MGWTVHHAIIVTTFSEDYIDKAHRRASEIFPTVSPALESETNGWWSFFVPPDGSKEGWLESVEGNDRRAAFAGWIREQAYPDGSNVYRMIEVAYDEVDDYGGPVVTCVDGKPVAAVGDVDDVTEPV